METTTRSFPKKNRTDRIGPCLAAMILFFGCAQAIGAASLSVVDASGQRFDFAKPPGRVISLVPSVTEMLFGIGAGDVLAGVTIHDTCPPEAAGLPVVGGFYHPSIERIDQLSPDLIFLSQQHKAIRQRYAAGHVRLIELDSRTIEGSYNAIRLLGKLFRKEAQAGRLIADIQAELDLVARKMEKIPPENRRRVIRIMDGAGTIMTPGKTSFQDELILAAGGIAPDFVRDGAVVPITLAQWRKYNPQVIYGCEDDKNVARETLIREGWKDVEAVRNGQVFYFPCDLTCRVSTRTGYFVSWLASRIYGDSFAASEDREETETVLMNKTVTIDLPHVSGARIVESRIDDFIGKTLLIDFMHPQSVLSTLEGWRNGIQTVGNHYLPPQTWTSGHQSDLADLQRKIMTVVGLSGESTSLLFTGANMDHLAVTEKAFKDMRVYALITAGVQSNALRTSKDSGGYYEPGTINIILLTNMRLTPRAMTRAIITATEAKTAALQDLDIRSSETPLSYGATGTGTDNILIAQGIGRTIDNTGGHTKMGELIAAVVHAGVIRAVSLQNRLTGNRSIFSRLRERGITPSSLIAGENCECGVDQDQLVADLEAILMDPRYAGFLTAALSISDASEQGLVGDLSAHESWCRLVGEEIAGGEIEATGPDFNRLDRLPAPLRAALKAILSGLYQQRIRNKDHD
ncbi:MAG: adenosylcobinamide amidohydrolase [Thermodesulfobacteriota bacterium]